MTTDINHIRTLEDHTFRAWPALETRIYDGWLLRFAKGYTRRSNSINPIYETGDMPLAEKIKFCEGVYSSHDLSVTYKMTPAIQPGNLDEVLAQYGYEKQSGALVQKADLSVYSGEIQAGAVIAEAITESWITDFMRLNAVNAKHKSTMQTMLESIRPGRCFMSIQREGETVAVGLGVHESGYIGIFDVVTSEVYRRQGIGRALVSSLLAWGKADGAHTAYLQVVPDNAAALGLYAGFGFATVYEYWYRVLAT